MTSPVFTQAERELIRAYINSPASLFYYESAFTRFRLRGFDSFAWHWSWWAFWGGPLFLLYRKLYIEAILLFIVGLFLHSLPFGTILYMVLRGGVLTYLIYRRFQNKLAHAKALSDSFEDQKRFLQKEGGTSLGALLVGIFAYLLFGLGLLLHLGLSVAFWLLVVGPLGEWV